MFKKALKEHISVFSDLSFIEENIIELLNMILNTIDKKGKILIFGNGGSAADAQHFAAELVVKFEKKRQPIAAIALSTDTSIITAISNDLSFDEIFSRQIQAIANKEDLLVGISTSGKSQNVIKGFQAGKELNLPTVYLQVKINYKEIWSIYTSLLILQRQQNSRSSLVYLSCDMSVH